MSLIKNIYQSIIKFLANHSKLAFILSHGGIHLLVLFLLAIVAFSLYKQTNRNENANYKHIKISAYENSDSIGELIYFPRILSGQIDLDNEGGKCDSISLAFHFFRGDIIQEDYLNYDDSYLFNKNDSICFDIESNYGLIGHKQKTIKEKKIIHKSNVKEVKDLNIPINFVCNKENVDEASPTSIFFLEFDIDYDIGIPIEDYIFVDSVIYSQGCITINYGHTGINDYKPYEVKYAYPEPDKVTPFYLEYNRQESIEHILKNNGVYVILENVVARNKTNRLSLQFSILIGAIIAFMLDIIVNLILKWRRLAKRRDYSSQTPSSKQKTELKDNTKIRSKRKRYYPYHSSSSMSSRLR